MLQKGGRIQVPEGTTLFDYLTSMVERVETNKQRIMDLTGAIDGMHSITFRKGRDIIKIAQMIDRLPPKEASLLNKAVSLMNATRQVAGAHKLIKPIRQRFWETKVRRDKPRLVYKFFDRLTPLMQACCMAQDLKVPAMLSEEETDRAMEEVNEALESLQVLKAKIGKEGHYATRSKNRRRRRKDPPEGGGQPELQGDSLDQSEAAVQCVGAVAKAF